MDGLQEKEIESKVLGRREIKREERGTKNFCAAQNKKKKEGLAREDSGD